MQSTKKETQSPANQNQQNPDHPVKVTFSLYPHQLSTLRRYFSQCDNESRFGCDKVVTFDVSSWSADRFWRFDPFAYDRATLNRPLPFAYWDSGKIDRLWHYTLKLCQRY